MQLDEVATHAHERLGLEIQAGSRLRPATVRRRRLEVWSLLTKHGRFWLVAEGGAVELFRAAHGDARSTAVAVRQFLELHPDGPEAPATPRVARRVARRVTPRAPKPSAYDCRTCGARVTPQRPSVMQERQLCRRCRHAEYERELYRNDPAYRAQALVRNAKRYQRHAGRGAT